MCNYLFCIHIHAHVHIIIIYIRILCVCVYVCVYAYVCVLKVILITRILISHLLTFWYTSGDLKDTQDKIKKFAILAFTKCGVCKLPV